MTKRIKYYSIEHAAQRLKRSPEWVLQQMIAPEMVDGVPGSFIVPLTYFAKPLLLINQKNGNREERAGWFRVHGMQEAGFFYDDEMCYPDSSAQYQSRYGRLGQIETVIYDGKQLEIEMMFLPVRILRIHKNDLWVSNDDIARLKPPKKPRKSIFDRKKPILSLKK